MYLKMKKSNKVLISRNLGNNNILTKNQSFMKKFIFLVPLAFLLAGCAKEYQCTQTITKQVNGVEIDNHQNILYSDRCLDSECFNYEQMSNDTLTISKTNCK